MQGKDRIDVNATAAVESHWGDNDHFLRLMFFQPSHGTALPELKPRALSAGPHAPLRQSRAAGANGYALPYPAQPAPVNLDTPAIEVMTDLRRVAAVTTGPFASIEQANRIMVSHGVRALFVVDEGRQLLGIVTSADTLGEKPVQFAQERGVRHDEVTVRDVMTPAGRIEVIELDDVRHARVGDVVATLRHVARQHALAVEEDRTAGGQRVVRGIFSLTQIARQLGLPPQPVHDIGRTFAEIEAAIST